MVQSVKFSRIFIYLNMYFQFFNDYILQFLQQNYENMVHLVEKLKSNVHTCIQGDAKSQSKHLKKGKMLARDRIDALIDPGSPFLEFSQLAAHRMYGSQSFCAGIVTGIGQVHG